MKLFSFLVLACGVSVIYGQVLTLRGRQVSPGSSALFFSIVESTNLKTKISSMNSSLNEVQTQINRLNSVGNNDDLREASEVLIRFVSEVVSIGHEFTSAVMAMTSDVTIPSTNLVDQFRETLERVQRFIAEEYENQIEEVGEYFGCTVRRGFDRIFQSIRLQIFMLAEIVTSIDVTVAGSEQTASDSIAIIHLVNAMESSILVVKGNVANFVTLVGKRVTGWQSANSFISQVYFSLKNAISSVRYSRNGMQSTLAAQRITALSNYHETQFNLKTQFSQAIETYSVFSTDGRLNRLAREFDKSYLHLYNFLRRRNRTDASKLGRSYRRLVDEADRTVEVASDIFFDAMRRTITILTDIALEYGTSLDSCFFPYSIQLTSVFSQLTSLVQSCIQRESPRWTAITNAESAVLSLLQKNADELTTNIAKCSKFKQFITSSSDYNRAEACLRTNLEDTRDLVDFLEPQLDLIISLVKQQVEASSYRFENCFFSKVHDLAALLKSTRASIAFCALQFDEDCVRDHHDDDEHDFHRLRRCESRTDEVDEGELQGSSDDLFEQEERYRKCEQERRCERSNESGESECLNLLSRDELYNSVKPSVTTIRKPGSLTAEKFSSGSIDGESDVKIVNVEAVGNLSSLGDTNRVKFTIEFTPQHKKTLNFSFNMTFN